MTQTHSSTMSATVTAPRSLRLWGWLFAATLAAPTDAQVAAFSTIGQGCGGSGAPGFYELFTGSSPNDLQGLGLTMIWTGTNYVVLQGALPIVPPTGAPRAFGDDQTQSFTLPFPLSYPGGVTNTLWVCSNGWMSPVATTSTTFSESVSGLLTGPPRFCLYWDDLNPGAGGTVHAETDAAGDFHVTFTNVPEFSNSGSNTMQITFAPTGQVELKWGTMTAQDGLVGYHPGGGAADPGGTDLSLLQVEILGDGTLPLGLTNLNGARPILGQVFNAQVQNVPAGAGPGVFILGLAQMTPPLDLSFLGMVGCSQYATADNARIFLTGGPSAIVPINFNFPGSTQFSGMQLFAQAAVFAGAQPGGIIASNGARLLLGLQ